MGHDDKESGDEGWKRMCAIACKVVLDILFRRRRHGEAGEKSLGAQKQWDNMLTDIEA
jgi:hypothetical protein